MKIIPIIEKDGLARRLGGDEYSNISRSTRLKVEKLQTVFEEFVKPSLFHQNVGVDSVEKGTVHLEDGLEFKSPKLSEILKNSDDITCYIATLGDGVEGEIERLMSRKRMAEAYILDAMASVAVDNMVSTFRHRLNDEYKNQNKQLTVCFSPGYCDWPLIEQKKLFKLLDSQDVDVELNDSCLMTPRKSISGVFGIQSDTKNSKILYSPCWDCNKTDCPARRAPEREPEREREKI
ncbi:MAG: vitamin B12 dependent-methionine synthase activation domain-containing protein [Pseudomonadota bacterium]|nr:vitamin B12 dependent-methionine synthase activation domain-containing protein [Pseudomonadota bacterium]